MVTHFNCGLAVVGEGRKDFEKFVIMGIRGLETFVKDFVPNGFVEVSIEVEIKKYAR